MVGGWDGLVNFAELKEYQNQEAFSLENSRKKKRIQRITGSGEFNQL